FEKKFHRPIHVGDGHSHRINGLDELRKRSRSKKQKGKMQNEQPQGKSKYAVTFFDFFLLTFAFCLHPSYFILCIKCSPTGSALAIIVSAGFAAPLEQKMLPSTT